MRLLDKLGLSLMLVMPFAAFFGIAMIDVVISSIAVLFVCRSILVRDFAYLRQTWVRLALLLWVYAIALSFFAPVPKQAIAQAAPFVRFILFALGLQYWLLKNEAWRRWLLYSIGAALLLVTLNTFVSFLTGLNLLGRNGFWTAGKGNFEWVWDRDSVTRLRGLNGKANTGIIITWMCFPFMTAVLFKVSQRLGCCRQRVAYLGMAVLIVTAILLTGERTAFLELGLGFVMMFIFMPALRKTLFIFACICLLMLALSFSLSQSLWTRNVVSVLDQTHRFSQDVYGHIFLTSLKIFKDHPIWGVGLNQYHYLSNLPQYVVYGGYNAHPQNIYLEWLMGTGLVGTALFLGILICWCRRFWRARHLLSSLPIAQGAMIALFVRVWPFASTTSFFTSWGGFTFWWMAAWVLASIAEVEEKN